MVNFKSLLAAAVTMGLGATAQAAIVAYDSKTAFESVFVQTGSEDFNGVAGQPSFSGTAFDLGSFSLMTSGANLSTDEGRNAIDQPPPLFSSFNVDGTAFANILLNASDQTFTIVFSEAITAFGADFGGMNNSQARTSVTVAGETVVPSVTSGNQVRFFGVVSDVAFTTLVFAFNENNDGFSMDNVVFGTGAFAADPVPLPAAAVLFAPAIGALVGLRRKKKAAA